MAEKVRGVRVKKVYKDLVRVYFANTVVGVSACLVSSGVDNWNDL